MTPEKFIRRLREVIPDSQKASLTELLRRIEALQEWQSWVNKIESAVYDDETETAEGKPDTGEDRQPVAVGEDRQRHAVLLSGDDRESPGVSE